MHERMKPREIVLIGCASALALDVACGQQSRKNNARTILSRVKTLAGKLYNALRPFWSVAATPKNENVSSLASRPATLIVRWKDFPVAKMPAAPSFVVA